MGWAPFWHTGLFHPGKLHCDHCHWITLSILLVLLLDNVPFSTGLPLIFLTIFLFLQNSGDGWSTYFARFAESRSQTLTTSRSQVRATRNRSVWWVFWFSFVNILAITPSVQGSEGCAGNMDSVRAAVPGRPSAKEHVEELQYAFEQTQTNKRQCIKKRSYKRALRRAETHGFTLYRGRFCTAQQLGTVYKGTIQDVSQKLNITHNSRLKRKRITCFNWNSSGLSPSGWDFFQQWIECQRLDVIMIQETHWRHTNEWVMEHYYAMHSGIGDGRAGLLCLVSKALCQAHDLSWNEVVPGRLMHIRIHGRDKDLDFINIYQHIHARDRMEDRNLIWTELQTLLTNIPKRNHLTLMGDWNTTLGHTSTAVGMENYLWKSERCGGPKHTDAYVFHNILQQFDLTAVNSWDALLGPTYIFGDQSSRIDFVICRRHHSDATSKHVQYLSDFPLNCNSGAHHIPQIASLLKVWHQTFSETSTGWTRSQRLELHRQWTQTSGAVEQLQNDIRETILALPRDGNRFEHVHNAMNSFPAPQAHQRREAVHKFDITPFQLFQAHSQHLRDLRHPDMRNFFKAWFHVHHRQRARKQMRLTSATARKQRLNKIFQAAGRAEAAKDHFRMYQAIRELAPKQPYRKIQIRDKTGTILNPTDAADRIKEWLIDLYCDPEAESVCRPFTWPFTETEFQQGLHDLPALKALAPGFAPAPYWHSAAEVLAPYLQEYFCIGSEQMTLPRQWTMGSLCLLPKHTRRSHAPQDLRPITLLEPCLAHWPHICLTR